MTRRMLINAQRPEEVRIAVVSDNTLDQYEVAATESGLCRGNIYRGVVANVQRSGTSRPTVISTGPSDFSAIMASKQCV